MLEVDLEMTNQLIPTTLDGCIGIMIIMDVSTLKKMVRFCCQSVKDLSNCLCKQRCIAIVVRTMAFVKCSG